MSFDRDELYIALIGEAVADIEDRPGMHPLGNDRGHLLRRVQWVRPRGRGERVLDEQIAESEGAAERVGCVEIHRGRGLVGVHRHKRCAQRDPAADQHGDRAVPGDEFPAGGAGAAADAALVPGVRGDGDIGAGEQRRGGAVRGVLRRRVQGAAGGVRDHDDG